MTEIDNICQSLLSDFEKTRIKTDIRITQLECCLKQIYEFGRRTINPYSPFVFKYVFICRDGKSRVSPHLQIVIGKSIYDPFFQFLRKIEGNNVFLSETLGLQDNDDFVARRIRSILNHILIEYTLHDKGMEDLKRCKILSFPEYLMFHKRLE